MNNNAIRIVGIGVIAAGFWLSGCNGDDQLTIQTVSEYNPAVPVAGVKVQVNDLAWATTDESGKVRFGSVESPYTVRVFQTKFGTTTENQFDDVWELIEKSANPLVIEVDGTGAGDRLSIITGDANGLSGEPDSRCIGAQLEPDDAFQIYYAWQGSTPHSAVLRAFEVDQAEPPTHYIGYASKEVVLDAPLVTEPDAPGSLSGVTLEFQSVTEEHVSGQVIVPAALAPADINSYLYLEFPESYEPFLLGSGAFADQSTIFDYVFPQVTGSDAVLSIGASLNPGPGSPRSRVTQKVGLPSSGIKFDLPAPAELQEPADGASIEPAAVFKWSATPGSGRYSLHATCIWQESGDKIHRVTYNEIETTITQASLPSIPGLVLPSGAICQWDVYWFPTTGPGESRWDRYSVSTKWSATIQ